MTKDEALRLALEALEKLWGIIDDIDTYGDMAKADEKLYRTLVERRQRQRFEETGISTDGYELHGGAITAIKAALEAKDEPIGSFMTRLQAIDFLLKMRPQTEPTEKQIIATIDAYSALFGDMIESPVLPKQEAKDEPVAHSVVAGALFDFMGWLTSREKRLILSSVDEASPAVEAITEFAKKRNLSLKYAEVGYWMEFLSTPPQQEAKDEPVAYINVEQRKLEWAKYMSWDTPTVVNLPKIPLYTTPPQRTWVGLTDEEISEVDWKSNETLHDFARAIEAKLRSKNHEI